MTTTLISFLGRTPKSERGYRTTQYVFDDGYKPEPLAFFGWTLQQRFKPERMVILGTSGSMWDHLFETDIDLGEENADERVKLMEACEQKAVTQEMLDRLAPKLAQRLGCELSLNLITYARTEAEQVGFLHGMAAQVPHGGQVHLDVTHGFRHLPMLSLLAALYLRISHKAQIKHIWYGAFDEDSGHAQVHDLSGLLRIADGFQALSSFDKDGDYGVLLPLFDGSGLSENAREALGKAAYYENILNVGAATGELRKASKDFDQIRKNHESSLLLPVIRQRLEWLNQQKQFEKQTYLAHLALQRHDYLRSILYAYEAVITQLCLIKNVPIVDFEKREEVRKAYEKRRKLQQTHENYMLLKNLRNQVAHGTRGDSGAVQRLLLDEKLMAQEVERLLRLVETGELTSCFK